MVVVYDARSFRSFATPRGALRATYRAPKLFSALRNRPLLPLLFHVYLVWELLQHGPHHVDAVATEHAAAASCADAWHSNQVNSELNVFKGSGSRVGINQRANKLSDHTQHPRSSQGNHTRPYFGAYLGKFARGRGFIPFTCSWSDFHNVLQFLALSALESLH